MATGSWLTAQEPYNAGTPYGMHDLADPEFVIWFLSKCQADPLWPRALPLVDGGNEQWQRFERIMTPRMGGRELGATG